MNNGCEQYCCVLYKLVDCREPAAPSATSIPRNHYKPHSTKRKSRQDKMCRSYEFVYGACGHSSPIEYRFCESRGSCDITHNLLDQDFDPNFCQYLDWIRVFHLKKTEFCASCFLLPDPRQTQLCAFNLKDFIQSTPPFTLEIFESIAGKVHEVIEKIEDNEDMLAFVGAEYQPLSSWNASKLMDLYAKLTRVVWICVNTGALSPDYHLRLQLLQMRTFIEHGIIYDEEKLWKAKQNRQQSLLEAISRSLTKVDQENLELDAECLICKSPFTEGIDECGGYPVKTNCNPVNHLYGHSCITEWAMQHSECPLCRQPLFSEEIINNRISMPITERVREITTAIVQEPQNSQWIEILAEYMSPVYV